MEDNKDLNVEVTEEVKEEEIVEIVDATENKEDETKEEINENLNITADDTSTPPSEDAITDTTQSQVVNEFVNEKEISTTNIVAEQTEQLEAIKKEYEGLKEINKTLSDKIKELENDIASLRENPFYKSGRTSSDLKMKNTDEYSKEDVERMRKRI